MRATLCVEVGRLHWVDKPEGNGGTIARSAFVNIFVIATGGGPVATASPASGVAAAMLVRSVPLHR